jgi:hypothetical protein
MTAKELFVEAMRRSDANDQEGFLALQAPDCTWITPNAQPHGREELQGWLAPWYAGFPVHRRHELVRVDEAGGTVYAEGVFHGVNEGALETPEGTLPATGRQLHMRFSIAVDVDHEAGCATEVRLYFDQLDFLGQLGLLPEPAQA